MIVLAVIAAVIAALLFIPIKIEISFHGRFELWVRVLFLRFKLLPREEKFEEASEPKPVRTEKPKEPSERPKKKPEKPKEPEQTKTAQADEAVAEEEVSLVDRFLHYYSIAAEFLDPFRRALRLLIRIDELNVAIRVGTLDAADTAVYTGMTWAVVGNLLALVARFVTIKRPNITVEPAYNESVLAAEGDCIIHTNIANIIGTAAIVAFAYLKFRKNRRNKK